jgi:hypothetical protein
MFFGQTVLAGRSETEQRVVHKRFGRCIERSFEKNSAFQDTATGTWLWSKLNYGESSEGATPALVRLYKGVDMGQGFVFRCDRDFNHNYRGVVSPKYDFIRIRPSDSLPDIKVSWLAELLAVMVPVTAGLETESLCVILFVRYMLEVEEYDERPPAAAGKSKTSKKRGAPDPLSIDTSVFVPLVVNKYLKKKQKTSSTANESKTCSKQVGPSPAELPTTSPKLLPPLPQPAGEVLGINSRFRQFGYELELETPTSKVLDFKYECVRLSEVHQGIAPAALYPDVSYNKDRPLKEHRFFELDFF